MEGAPQESAALVATRAGRVEALGGVEVVRATRGLLQPGQPAVSPG